MGLTRLSIQRPLVVAVAIFATLIFAIVSYRSLAVELLPNFSIPTVTLSVGYPGAGPRAVEEQVTRPLEDAVVGLANIESIASTSLPGRSVVTITFRDGIDVKRAASDVQQRVDGARRELPAEAEPPVVATFDINANIPVATLVLVDERATDPATLYRLLDDEIRPQIEAVDGVGQAQLIGARAPEILVEVAPERLRDAGLAISDVAAALATQNQQVAAGVVRRGRDGEAVEFGLRVDGRVANVAALTTLPVTGRNGQGRPLGEFATIQPAIADAGTTVRLNGQPATGLLVLKAADANITDVGSRLQTVVATLNSGLPDGLRLEITGDATRSIRESVRAVQLEFLSAVLLTGLVLLLFLHTLRATLIILFAVPVAVGATIIIMQLTGLTINILSLLGLVTSIGILVDDSIVIIENISRRLRLGEEPQMAALNGRAEIGLAAVAITLVDVVVYGPILFLSGTVGESFRNFALVITATTLCSLLVAFTVTPLLAARWLRTEAEGSGVARWASAWEPAYQALLAGYRRLLDWSLRRPWVVVVTAGLMLAGSVLLVPFVGTEFFPDQNSETSTIVGELPNGAALEAADAAARQWEAALLADGRLPERRSLLMRVGAGGSELERGPRFLSLTLDIGPSGERRRSNAEISRQVVEAGNAVPNLRVRSGSGGGPGGPGQAVQVRLVGRDLETLLASAALVQAQLAALPVLADVTTSTSDGGREIVVRPDPVQLQEYGLTTQAIGNALRLAYQGVVPAVLATAEGDEIDIRLRLPEAQRRDPAAIAALPLIGAAGQLISLGQVARLDVEPAPSQIDRLDRQRVITVGAAPAGVSLGAATNQVTAELQRTSLPPGIRWELAGQSQAQREAFADLGLVLIISLVLVYLLLVLLFGNLLSPLVILLAVPLSFIGAILGLLVFRDTLNILSLIGVISLVGLVGKNAILVVDYTNTLRAQGISRTDALLMAGPTRLRPILMTSAAVIVSLTPVALRLGEGGALRGPLAAVIVGGMITSTILSTLFVPVTYAMLDDLQAWLQARLRGGWRRSEPARRPVIIDPPTPAD